MVTWSMFAKLIPVAVTTVPVGPVYGVSLSVIVNGLALFTVIGWSGSVASVTVIRALVASKGTFAVNLPPLGGETFASGKSPIFAVNVAGKAPSIVSECPID